MGKIRLFVWGDAVTPTGFSRVLHSILGNLPEEEYDISWLGVNYMGDPHIYNKFRIYPASIDMYADPYGFNRIKSILQVEKPDIIFILNDAWVIKVCLTLLKDFYKDITKPKIVTYIPVDALDHDPEWYTDFSLVDKIVAYTSFGQYVINKASNREDIVIIPHGVDSSIFYKINDTKENIKKQLYPDKDDMINESFIVLNASRNQPRKRLDITMQGFSLFAKDKPLSVKLYMHCGITDTHIHVTKLAERYGIIHRLIVTNKLTGVQTIPDASLNLIYNATDVGLNTSIGEGWCLPCMEHAVTGAPQVVPGHSALKELYEDCGILMPVSQMHILDKILTTGYIVDPMAVATALEELYSDKDKYKTLSEKSIIKFTNPIYEWKNIAKTWDKLFKELM